MIERIVSGLVRDEVEELKRRASGLTLSFAGLALLLVAAGFLFLGLYFYLAETMPAWQAALAVAGWVAALALLLLFAGRAMMRRRRHRSEALNAEIRAFMGQFSSKDGTARTEAKYGLIAAVVLAGLILGRRLTR